MSADWQVGDLALCVAKERDPDIITGWDAVVGGVYTVSGVDEFFDGRMLLDLAEDEAFHPDYAFCASRFRKITPPEADEFDREVIELMTGKPAKIGAPA